METAWSPRRWIVVTLVLVAVLCCVESATRLGENAPFYRYTLPRYGLGYFWGTPLGWGGFTDGVAVNRDSLAFDALASFLRGETALAVPLDGNTYTRLTGYSLLGTLPAPLVGRYLGFVVANVAFWIAGAMATYALAVRHTGSRLVAVLAAVLVATAPAYEALVGQALPYVVSYSLFAIGVWYCERAGLFERRATLARAALVGFAAGSSFLVYDLYMLPAFVVLYGLRRMPLRNLAVFLVLALAPRVIWTIFWQAEGLPKYSINENEPLDALRAWIASAQGGSITGAIKAYGALGAHVLLNVAAAFMLLPLLLALWELAHRLREPGWDWFAAVLMAGFAPAAFMVSTWPHLPRWYAYGFVGVYILAAAGAVRLAERVAGAQASAARYAVLAAVVIVPLVLVSNLDLLGQTRPMELLLFQPEHWSYLWSR